MVAEPTDDGQLPFGKSLPLLLWWGPQYLSIYNDAYRPVLGNKHPKALGQPVSECWSEIWHILKPLIDSPFNGGAATWMDDLMLEIDRHNFVEETHFTIAYSPVPDETALHGIGGVLATVHEITDKVVSERRVQVLRDLGARAVQGKTAELACAVAAETLGHHAKDIPFALLYLLDPEGRQARLAGITGVGMGEPISPIAIDLRDAAASGAGWPLAEAVRSEATITVEGLKDRFGCVPSGPWSTPPHCALVVPARSNKAHQLAGLLVAGVSARIRFDDLYQSFFELVATQIATAVANARAYEEERRRAEALAEIDRAKTAFFSNVSHEFRTPLALMLGPLEAMLNDPSPTSLSATQRLNLSTAHRNSLRLLRLVNALLDFSRIEVGRVQANYQPTDLAALTAELASGFRSATERAKLFLEVDCTSLSEPVFVDRDMWEKVVLNLLSNAFKFTFEGGITVSVRAMGNGAALTVRDTGVGIPEHELPRLFDRFHRIEGQRSRSFEGSGIGLALVDELVRLHGGTIEVQSKPNQGAEFVIRIPFGTAHLQADQIGATSNQVSTAMRTEILVEEVLRWLPDTDAGVDTAVPALFDAPDGSRSTVLLADDNADMRGYMQHLLRQRYNVTAVADGQAALDTIRKDRPDLVLSDVMMPGLDGFELLRAIREDPELGDLPFIMLSARAGEESRIEGLSGGANDYLAKPFSARELLACVDGNLKLARLRQKMTAELRLSERRFRALVNASSGAVYCMSRDWSEIRYLMDRDFIADIENPSCTWLEKHIHPDDRPRVTEAVTEAVRTKSIFALEHRVRRADGSFGWTFSRAIPLLDDNGEITEWFGMSSDVTQRKRAEQTLRQRTAQFETLFNEAPLGVYLIDADFQIREVNPTALPVFGDIPDLIGRDFEEVLHTLWSQEYADEILRLFRHTLATGETYFVPERSELRRDRGVIEIYEWQINRIELPEGRYGVVCYSRDVSAQVFARKTIAELEERLRHLNERLEARVNEEVTAREQAQGRLAQAQRMEALGQLAGGIAHDFNNVLQVVSGALSLIQRRAEAPQVVRQLARLAGDAAERGAAITGRLLTFARRGELRAIPLPPRPLLKTLSEILAPTLGPDISLRIEVPTDAPPLLADKAQLETVLVNLAVNARDAMPAGGTLIISASPERVINVRTHTAGLQPGVYLRLELRDTGTGMDPATLVRASEPFFTTKAAGRGTGLGLAMARGFAEQSGGGFAIRSMLGQGTTVTLWFPQTEALEDGPARPEELARPAAPSARVLVVDDHAMVREVLARQLKALHFQVIQAPDGSAALAWLDAGGVADLLVTDFSMPGMNGLMLIEEARRRRPRLPALLLTGYADANVLGAIEHTQGEPTTLLRKPVSDKDMAERAAALLTAQAAN